MIYFDHAATALPDQEILDEAYQQSLTYYANPSSPHAEGKKVKNFINQCRIGVATILGVKSSSIIFNSGATEGNQFIMLQQLKSPSKGKIIVGKAEHSALYDNILTLKQFGFSIQELNSNELGLITPDRLAKALTTETKMVAIMLLNNEIGAIQPIQSLVKVVRDYQQVHGRSIHVHVDATQALGKINFNLPQLDCDSAVLSAHKVGGPRGSGLLYLKDPKGSFLKGGGQELNLRSGTENIFAIAGMTLAIKKYYNVIPSDHSIETYLINRLIAMGATINPVNRLSASECFTPLIVNCSFNPLPAEVLVRSLSVKGLMVNTGSACANNSKHSSRTLEAMNLSKEQAFSAIRLSLGPKTTLDEAKEAMDILAKTVEELKP